MRRCCSASMSAALSPTPCWRSTARIFTAKAPTTPGDQSRGDRRRRGGAGARRGAGGRCRAVLARDDGRDQRAARGPRCADRVRGDRRVHRPRRARAPEPPRAVPPVRGPGGADHAARAPLRRPRADDSRRPAAAARGRRQARAAPSPPASPRRSPSHCCTPTAIRSTSASWGPRLATALPDVHVSLSHEVVGTFREFERAATTEVDAALSPLLGWLPAAPAWPLRRARAARAGDHAVKRRPDRHRRGRRARGLDGALGASRRRRGGGVRRPLER